MPELPKAYTPRDVEGAIYERWLAADVFAPDGAGSTADPALPPFTIIQPPPNVTGSLHLGHAQRTAVEDLMIRHARMRGHRALFLPGLDHASIAAQFVLDGILAKEGESRQSLGRERYLERMREFVATTREVMLAQQRRVGASADWGRLRYTMDDGSAKAVRVAFNRLYEADLAYRTEALVNWCPGCRTSVSDLEVIATPETGHALVGPLPPDRPDDRRARSGRDDHDRDDPAGDDPRRHGGRGPPRRPALRRPRRPAGAHPVRRARRPDHRRRRRRSGVRDRRGQDHAGPRPRRPRDRPAPRSAGAVDPGRRRQHRRHGHALRRAGPLRGARARSWPTSRRAATSSAGGRTRWSSAAASAATTSSSRASRPSGSSGPGRSPPGRSRRPESGRTRILPERFEKTWEHWLTNIRDWNVSRQLWWGHRIPAWYCPDGHVTVSAEIGRPGRLRRLRPAGGRAPAGPGHLRHLVQLRAVAVLDPRLAGRDRRLRDLLPDVGDGDRLRHHLLLGRPDDDAGHRADRDRAVPHGLPVRPDPRPARPEDVQDQGQRRRPAGRHRRVRRRRPAVRGHPRRDAGQRPAVRAGQARAGAQLRQQAVERDPLRDGRPAELDPGGCRAPAAGRAPPRTRAERWLLSRAAATTEAADAADGRATRSAS